MGNPQRIIRYEINRIKVDHAAQKTEHHEINIPELHGDSEKGNPRMTEISNYGVNGK